VYKILVEGLLLLTKLDSRLKRKNKKRALNTLFVNLEYPITEKSFTTLPFALFLEIFTKKWEKRRTPIE
jgi:hypothetical protein